ncbi:M50 family metallopeptidase [Roseovarius sp. EGI FJ00037]|uniref:M50 family metallopeptidase n=1 Tax=Roseovarius salincola TaxID=2978479 RepID=UPI0022A82801|nr:M50 family metallopeptidase [Roseovarius sp. EGI FJ00037]MCZ0811847.1 M50 family metallopeptidase [Roseovarius sp. EGI FJ00037]
MSLSAASTSRRRHLAPPTNWQPFRPVLPQALIAAGLGGLALLLAFFAVPGLTSAMISYYVTFLHEAAHSVFGYFASGEIGKITLHADGGGEALVATGGPIGVVITAGSGLIIPAWLGAGLLGCAATRIGIELILLALGLLTAWFGYHHVDAEGGIPLALGAVAAVALLTAILPLGRMIKAAVGFFFGFAITKGVIASAGYAYLEWADAGKNEPADPRLIADALGLENIAEVSPTLIGLMVAGYAIAALLTWAWFQRHSH